MNAAMVDARTLPSLDMLSHSLTVDTTDAEQRIRRRYESKLAHVPGPRVKLVNTIDRQTPALSFRFINRYHMTEGTESREDLMAGCAKCKPNMGANRGCEYTKLCDCLEDAAPDIESMTEEQRRLWDARQAQGDPSTEGMPKRFPYMSTGHRTGCLVPFYLKTRHPIYECNELCKCGPLCKNRNVQRGRKVELEIFKTPNRGFGTITFLSLYYCLTQNMLTGCLGLRCPVDLLKGQFIDTYLGEVITDAEADRREAQSIPGSPSYLFGLDKFVGDSGLQISDTYVVDGAHMGGITRFINHSCEPNVQMHTVSYNKHDLLLYDLAFFACEDIPANAELTFDYKDQDDPERNEDDEFHGSQHKSRVPCLCGSVQCRGALWT